MCHRLEELSDRQLTPAGAYAVLHDENLQGLDGPALDDFADLLVDAVNQECPKHASYAFDILYWIV